jgi:hypothetical protein
MQHHPQRAKPMTVSQNMDHVQLLDLAAGYHIRYLDSRSSENVQHFKFQTDGIHSDSLSKLMPPAVFEVASCNKVLGRFYETLCHPSCLPAERHRSTLNTSESLPKVPTAILPSPHKYLTGKNPLISHILTVDGVKPDPNKVQLVQD